MRFHVPQFIEVEDKIFGPLTFKQFIYLIGGAAIVFIFYSFLPLWLTVILGLPIAVFSLALAFLKINNQPFVKVIQNAFKYTSQTKLYIWKKKEVPTSQLMPSAEKETKEAEEEVPLAPKLTKRRLEDLAWSLDIKERVK